MRAAAPLLALLLATTGCAGDRQDAPARMAAPAMMAGPVTMAPALSGEWRVLAAVPRRADQLQAQRFVGTTVTVGPGPWRDHRGRTCQAPMMAGGSVAISELLGVDGAAADTRHRPTDAIDMVSVTCDGVGLVQLALWGPDQLVARDGDLLLFLEPSRGDITTPIAVPVSARVPGAALASGRGLHLLSDVTDAGARSGWNRFRGVPGFERLQARTVTVDIPGKGRMVRLFAIGADADLRQACDSLRRQGRYCMPMDMANRAVH